MSKPCPQCQAAEKNPVSGLYRGQCKACRVRLVKSARPSRDMQNRMFEWIAFAWGAGAAKDTEQQLKEETHADRNPKP